MDNGDDSFDELFGGDVNSTKDDTGTLSDDDVFGNIDEVPDVEGSSQGTVTLGKKQYATGLVWYSSDDPKKVAKEAVAYARSDDYRAEFFCIRSGENPQFGLGYKSLGHKNNMPSLAASLDKAFDDNWLGAFKVDGSIYIVAVREGMVLSACDQVYSVEEEARAAFSDLFYKADWEEVIAPDMWGIPNTVERDIIDVVGTTAEAKLRPANPLQKAFKILLIFGILGGIVFGALQYNEHLKEQDRLEAQREMRKEITLQQAREEQQRTAIEEARKKFDQAIQAVEDTVAPVLGIETEQEVVKPDVPPRPPWEGRRNGVGDLIGCYRDVMRAPIAVPGWQTTSVQCSNGQISVTLQKSGGTVLWAGHYLRENGYPDADFSDYIGASSLVHRYDASFVTDHPTVLQTIGVDNVRKYLRSHFAEMELPIEVTVQPNDPQSRLSRFYEVGNFVFSTDLDPTIFAPLLSKINGFVIQNTNFNINDGLWSIDGRFFHEREVPIPRPAPQKVE